MKITDLEQIYRKIFRFFNKKTLIGIYIFLGVCVLAVVINSGLNYLNRNNKKKQELKNLDYNNAVAIADKGDYGKAQAVLDIKLKETSDSKEQALIYMQKASIALNSSKYQDALDFAQKAEQLDPTDSTAALAGDAAKGLSNKPLAIDYYNKAISRLNPENELDRSDIRDYQQAIQELK